MLARLRQVPVVAYVFLAFSIVGTIVEVAYHFLPPGAIPAYGRWLASLSPVDRDFFGLALELTAHAGIAIGLMGLVATLLYQQMGKSDS